MVNTYNFIMSLNKIKECEFCGYNEHIICLTLHHLFPKYYFKPQPDFDREDRYVILCPTCHILLHRDILSKKAEEIINRKICVCEVKYKDTRNIENIIKLCRMIYNPIYKGLNTIDTNK